MIDTLHTSIITKIREKDSKTRISKIFDELIYSGTSFLFDTSFYTGINDFANNQNYEGSFYWNDELFKYFSGMSSKRLLYLY